MRHTHPQAWTKHVCLLNAVARSHTSDLHSGRVQVCRFKLPSRKATPWPFLLAQNWQIPSKNLLILCVFSWGCLALFRFFPSNVSNFWHLLRNQSFWWNFLQRLGHLPNYIYKYIIYSNPKIDKHVKNLEVWCRYHLYQPGNMFLSYFPDC